MDKKRELELLAYAKVCFDRCTNPFEALHLIKNNVNADECRDLSHLIGDIIENYLEETNWKPAVQVSINRAKMHFAETQGEP